MDAELRDAMLKVAGEGVVAGTCEGIDTARMVRSYRLQLQHEQELGRYLYWLIRRAKEAGIDMKQVVK